MLEDVVADEAAVEVLDVAWGGVNELGVPSGTMQIKEKQRVLDEDRNFESILS